MKRYTISLITLGLLSIFCTQKAYAQSTDEHRFCNGHVASVSLKVQESNPNGSRPRFTSTILTLGASSLGDARIHDADRVTDNHVIRNGVCRTLRRDIYGNNGSSTNPRLGVFFGSNSTPYHYHFGLQRRDIGQNQRRSERHYYVCNSIGCHHSYSEFL